MSNPPLSPYIHAASQTTFNELVLHNSKKGPVLVHFWSKKAGPCLRLHPILDALIAHYNGCLLLINLDVDTERKVAADYTITSVPTLKLFREGRVVESLFGFQSEMDLKIMLNRYVTLPSDIQLSKALQEYSEGKRDQAYQIISQAIIADPQNPRLPMTLCKLLKHEQQYQQVLDLMQSLPESIRSLTEMQQLRDEIDLIFMAEKIQDLDALLAETQTTQANIAERQQLVAFYILNKEYKIAFDILMEIHQIQPDMALPLLFKSFNLLGHQHPLVKKYRGYLAN